MPDDDRAAATKFGIGQPVRRSEDPRLLTGRGRFTDDVDLPGQVHAVVLRSPVAHAEIRAVATRQAAAMPGVLGVFTGADLEADGIGLLPCTLSLKNRDGTPLIVPPRPALAVARVRHVGQPVALAVAETRAQAQDAAEQIELDLDPLPAVVDVEEAAEPGAHQIWDEAPGNVCLDWETGDEDAVERAIAGAHHVTRLKVVNNRIIVAAMEPRAALAEYDRERGRFTLYTGSQGVMGMRNFLAEPILKVAPEKLRVITGDVGGSFGMKSAPYGEHVAILFAARRLGRPVKWCAERSESFLSDNQGRGSLVEAALALDRDGNFLALRVDVLGNMGAYLSPAGPFVPTKVIAKNVTAAYRTPAIYQRTRCVFTNTVQTGPYRGAGRPEANYVVERLVDLAARETGHDPIELRRRNFIPPTAMPYATPTGQTYDSGDFAAILDRARDFADVAGFSQRRNRSRAAGRLRGLGIASYLEVTAAASPELGDIRFLPDGTVTITTGTMNYGVGHATAFAQILSDRLGIPFARIRLAQNDSDEMIAGGGSGGSRSLIASGGALLEAADLVVARGRQLAGHVLEAAAADIEFGDGAFRVAGTDRLIGLMDLAQRLPSMTGLPPDLPDRLDVAVAHDAAPATFPNGCHVCEIEIDPDTGAVTIDRYAAVDDFGNLINPLLVEAQVHGGIAQGIGQALHEYTVYDTDGQLLSGTFMDYALPRAADVPFFRFVSQPVPATTNPMGVKGCGEAGVTGALPAVMNAVVDALAGAGVRHIDMPATPERVWRALRRGAAP